MDLYKSEMRKLIFAIVLFFITLILGIVTIVMINRWAVVDREVRITEINQARVDVMNRQTKTTGEPTTIDKR